MQKPPRRDRLFSGGQITSCLLLCLLAAAPAARGQQKNRGKNANKPPTIDAANLRPGTFRGRLVRPPGFDGDFVLEITVPRLVPKKNAGAARGRAARANPLANYQVTTVTQSVEFHATQSVKVRLHDPPQVFTEKGDIKKFTPAELNELKGKDRHLPGFEGSLADLQSNQIVQVTQHRAPAGKPAKDGNAPQAKEHKNVVTMILVVGKPPADQVAAKKGKKK